jgi:uncharacterized protein YndB with AHSA1/START domain
MTTMAETATTTRVFQVYIKAPAERIWDAITKSEFTNRYGYGGNVEFDLRAGGIYKAFASEAMRQGGAPDVVVEGEVIEADPPRRLVQTWHPVWDPQSAAEPPTRLTYEIEPGPGDVCKLTVVHELADAPSVEAIVTGSVAEAGGGWHYVLSDLKTLLETGRSLEES